MVWKMAKKFLWIVSQLGQERAEIIDNMADLVVLQWLQDGQFTKNQQILPSPRLQIIWGLMKQHTM